jgi:hypothetical protein
MHPVVVLIDPSSFAQVYGSQTIYQQILARKVPVTLVNYGADLRYSLESGFSQHLREMAEKITL